MSLAPRTSVETIVLAVTRVVAASCCLGLSVVGAAQLPRSAWMWTTASHPYGAANILGNAAKEQEVIANFGAWNFDRIYTSVGNLPLTNPSSVANWNATLSSYGIESQMLLGENTWIFPGTRPNLLSLLQTRFLNFNNSRTHPQERFAGLHLDIEPQALPAWQNGTGDKKEMLFQLRDTYAEVRALLNEGGAAGIPIYADLPVWFDSSSAIGWTNSAERDQWFADIAESLAGISLMAFERGNLSSIVSGVDWEVQNFNGEVRIGLNASEIGAGNTFANYAAFDNLAKQIEARYGDQIGGIDYQPFYTFVDRAPAPEFDADFNGDGAVDGNDFLVWQRGADLVGDATIGQGDANGSGSVDAFDLDVWKLQYGNAQGALSVIPEPRAFALAAVSWCGMYAGARALAGKRPSVM
jgi:hypothetical protein